MKRLVQEANLAWAVAEAAKPYLSAVERNAVFVAIGVGETFAAIRALLRSVEIKSERDLRRLIEEPLLRYLIGAAGTTALTRVPFTPKPRSWLRFPAPRHTANNAVVPSRCITRGFANRRGTS